MRFVSPILFAVAAVGIAWYNGQHADRALVLPFVDLLDASAANDPQRQGELTVYVFGALAIVLGIRDVVRYARDRAEG